MSLGDDDAGFFTEPCLHGALVAFVARSQLWVVEAPDARTRALTAARAVDPAARAVHDGGSPVEVWVADERVRYLLGRAGERLRALCASAAAEIIPHDAAAPGALLSLIHI